MKKIVFTAAIVVALGTVGYAIQRDGGQAPNDEKLSPIQVQNLEALGDIETWIELGYSDNCVSAADGICVKTPTVYYIDALPYPYTGD